MLYFDDVSEALIFRERAVKQLQVFFMHLEQLNQSIYSAQFSPPPIFLQSCEYSPDDVSAVRAASSVAGKPTICDDH